MATISWNDIPDDDSSISAMSEGSDHEDHKLEDSTQNSKAPQETVQKVKQLHPKVIENLAKLEQHKGNTVWLFLIGYQRNQENQIDQIISTMSFVKQKSKKPYKPNYGRNILVEVDQARDLIQNGYNQNEVNLKFAYSHVNQRQNAEGNIQQRNIRSPQNKLPSSRNTRSKGKYKEKKVKYIAKEQTSQNEKKKYEKNSINKVQIQISDTSEENLKNNVKKITENQEKKEEKKTEINEEYEVQVSKKKRKQKPQNPTKPKKLKFESHNPFSFFEE